MRAARSATAHKVEKQYFKKHFDESNAPAPSSVELDYMRREDNINDTSNLSINSYQSVGSRYEEKRAPGDQYPRIEEKLLPPVHDIMGNTLRKEKEVLEKQLGNLTAAMERKEAEQERTEARLRRIFSELETLKRTTNAEKIQSVGIHERAIILLREQHLKEMAGMTSSLSLQSSSNNLSERRNGDQIGGDANRRLLLQLNVMRTEQRRLEEQFSEERGIIQAESSTRIVAQERTLKV